jgi:hypothetical protein
MTPAVGARLLLPVAETDNILSNTLSNVPPGQRDSGQSRRIP